MSSTVDLCPACGRRPLANGLCACPAPYGSAAPVAVDNASTLVPYPNAQDGSSFGQVPTRPASSYDRVKVAMQQRNAPKSFSDNYLRSSESTFGLAGKLLLTLPVALLVLGFFAFKLFLSAAGITLAILAFGGVCFYLKQVWVPRR